MKKLHAAIGALLLSILMGCADKSDGDNNVRNSEAIAEQMQALLDDAVKSGAPGVTVAVATSEGVKWTGSAGVANLKSGEPITPDRLFGIGSITKTFVAVVIHQLVEEEKLRLTQTPAEILGADAMGDIPNSDTATVAHLLNHTSGIPSWEDDPKWIREGRGADLVPSKIWGKTETLDYIRNTEPLFEPGAFYSYANTNHTLLGLIIEKVTGNEATQEIKTRILDPIGLENIFLEGFDAYPRQRAAGRYHHATDVFKRDAGVGADFPEIADGVIDVNASNLSVEWTAGGMVASVHDMARYALALRDGELLNEESMARLYDWRPALGPGETSTNASISYGLFRFDYPDDVLIGHGGNVLGYTANMHWRDSGDVVVMVMANIGSMHSGGDVVTAYSLGRGGGLTALASAYVKALDN
ncbi:MAG: serine hydrolase domain-containing protein [Pseudomonadota bacterium]